MFPLVFMYSSGMWLFRLPASAGFTQGQRSLGFSASEGETEALGLMGAGLGVSHSLLVLSGFLWLCCFW